MTTLPDGLVAGGHGLGSVADATEEGEDETQ